MAEIYRNTSRFEYFDITNGTADATPAVVLQRAGVTDITLTPTHIVPPPAGVNDRWKVYVPLSATTIEGDFSLKWTAIIGGEPVVKSDFFTVVTPYITPEEIASREGWTIDVDQSRADLVIAERLARNIIDSICSVSFGATTKTVTTYGQQTDQLYIGERMQSITTLYEDGVLVVGPGFNSLGFPIELTETGVSLRISDPANSIAVSELMDTVVDIGQFKTNSRYDITGVFGYSYVPSKVTDAAWLLAKDYLCQDAVWRNKYIKTVTTQNWDFDFSAMAWWATGNAMVDRLLDEYRMPPMLVI
jgi:hypothetical protein